MQITITSNSTSTDRFFGGGPGLPPVLLNHPAQSVAPINGWKAALFGLPFVLCGLFIEAAAFHLLPVRGSSAPAWVVALIGAMFFSAGFFLFIHGIHGIVSKAGYNRQAAATPSQPWLFDFHWRPEGTSFSAFNAMVGRLFGALVWNAFLVPFFWIGATQRGAWLFLGVAGILALIGLFFWVRWVQMLGDLLRYGNSFLAYDEFPYFLGGTLRARLRAPRHLGLINSLTLTLRCIQERYVTTGSGNNRSTSVVCYELYKDVVALDHERLANFVGAEIPVEFRLPADKLTTSLADTPPTYWQIEAKGEARGADYQAYFLVPVYKKP